MRMDVVEVIGHAHFRRAPWPAISAPRARIYLSWKRQIVVMGNNYIIMTVISV